VCGGLITGTSLVYINYDLWTVNQGHNSGPKSGGTNSEEERGTFGSRGEREENREVQYFATPPILGSGGAS